MSYRERTATTTDLRADVARVVELLERAGGSAEVLDRDVASCPGWQLRDLVVHLGTVHRWATECVLTGEQPTTHWQERSTDVTDGSLAEWYAQGGAALLDALDTTPPDTPTWTPFPLGSPTVAVWVRRQTHETAMHRRDAESAVGAPGPIDPVLAADGIDEYLELVVPRLVQRDGRELPTGSAHLHCTDTDGEWTVEVAGGAYVVDRAHRKGDAAVRATAPDLLLRLWGRDVPDARFEVLGDASVAEAWLSIGGS